MNEIQIRILIGYLLGSKSGFCVIHIPRAKLDWGSDLVGILKNRRKLISNAWFSIVWLFFLFDIFINLNEKVSSLPILYYSKPLSPSRSVLSLFEPSFRFYCSAHTRFVSFGTSLLAGISEIRLQGSISIHLICLRHWSDREQAWIFFSLRKKHIFLHACATCSELPSGIRTMICSGILLEKAGAQISQSYLKMKISGFTPPRMVLRW